MSNYLQPSNQNACRQLPGTIFRIYIPAGTTINLLNLIELTSPTGICLILRLPFLSGECGTSQHHDYDDIFDRIRQAGGRIEAVNQ